MGVREFGRGPGTMLEDRVDQDRDPADSPGLRGIRPSGGYDLSPSLHASMLGPGFRWSV